MPELYNSNDMPSITDFNYLNHVNIDCVIFGFENNQLKALVAKLNYKGEFYTLPSGYILEDEDIEDAVQRILFERTGIKNVYLEHFKVFGKANRGRKEFLDALISENYTSERDEKSNSNIYRWFTKRVVSIGYYALVDISKVTPTPNEIYGSLEWYPIDNIPKMIMDFNLVLNDALKSLKVDIDVKANAFNLLPEKFTISEVQEVYECILQKSYVRTNFQKKILELDVLERLEKKYTGAKNKAPYLYRLKN